jgi:hypothetical protein
MKNKFLLPMAILTAIMMSSSMLAVSNAYAHEGRLYSIGDKDYWISVGSINEPVFVDDKSGAEAFVSLADPSDPLNSDANGTKNIEGLEKTIKFEISAGAKKKELAVEPAWRDPGHYEATFYPTIETTYNYRLFGTINNVTVSLDYQCIPGGVEEGTQENATKQISEGVTLKAQRGGFGCPASRADAGFPEPYVSDNEMASMIKELQKSQNSTSKVP